MPKVTIVIRAKDEEYWLGSALRQIKAQAFDDYEIVLVDSGSTDSTKGIFLSDVPEGILVELEGSYTPGKAINAGFRAGSGSLLVLLSAHCVPVDEAWLGNLVAVMDDPGVGAAYGRQVPLASSHPLDKRDLLNTFGVERRVQREDTFFHNANSIIRRDLWEAIPFDEETPHIEDRIWAGQIIPHGYSLVYEPSASVYHHHGIYHHQDLKRAEAISNILTRDTMGSTDPLPDFLQPRHQRTLYCFLGHAESTRGALTRLLDKVGVECPAGKVMVHTSDPSGVPAPRATAVARSPEDDGLTFVDIIGKLLDAAAGEGYFPTCVVYANLRLEGVAPGMLDQVITQFYDGTYDSVFFGREEFNNIWLSQNGAYRQLQSDYTPHQEKSPVFAAQYGLGLATRPKFVRSKELVGTNVGIIDLQGVS
jgi:GT2 family glycosyltransferase